MPQIKPLNWLFLYFVFILLVMMIMVFLFFEKSSFKLNLIKTEKKDKTWVW